MYDPEAIDGTLGRLLLSSRLARGLSEAEVARKLGVHVTTVSRWETDSTIPRPGQLTAIARALKIPRPHLANMRAAALLARRDALCLLVLFGLAACLLHLALGGAWWPDGFSDRLGE